MLGLIDWSLLPVQLFHDFCHFSDISFVARGSSSEARDFSAVTERERLPFAAESAFTFPGIPTWIGIQHKAMVFLALTQLSILSLSVLMAIFRWTWVSQCLLKQRMTEVVVTTGAISRAKLQSNHPHQQTNIQFFTGRIPFLSSKESSCRSPKNMDSRVGLVYTVGLQYYITGGSRVINTEKHLRKGIVTVCHRGWAPLNTGDFVAFFASARRPFCCKLIA